MPLNLIRKSTDSGVTWTRQFDTYFDINSIQRFSFLATSCSSTITAVIVGTSGQIRAATVSQNSFFSPSSGVTTTLTGCSNPTTAVAYACGVAGVTIKTTDLTTSGTGGTWTATTNTGSVIVNTDTLISIDFNTASIGVTIGWHSNLQPVLFTTTDGGINWVSQTLPVGITGNTNVRFTRVKMTGTTTAYASGYYITGGSFLLHATALNTWILLTIPSIERLKGFHFTSDTTGMIGGAEGKMYSTIDTGVTWTIKTMPPTLPFFDIGSIFFFSTLVGVATGQAGQYLFTTTGNWSAGSWSTRYYGKNIYSTCLASATVGWSAGEDGTIVTSTAATTTGAWTSQPISFTYNNIESMSFVSNNEGWATGHGGRILKTTDSGTTWIDQSIADSLWVSAVSAVSTTELFITGNFGAEGRTYHSTDGGSNFTLMTLPANTRFVINLYALDATHVWCCGWNGFIGYYDTSTLNTWVLQTTATSSTETFKSIHFFDTTHGLVVGNNNSIFYTTNGGTTWTAVSVAGLGNTDMGFVKVQMLSTTTAIATGVSKIWKISNLNTTATWTIVEIARESNLISCLSFYDANNGWAAGGRRIWNTTNGGTSWTEVNITHTNYGDSINVILARSASNIWISYQSILLFDFD